MSETELTPTGSTPTDLTPRQVLEKLFRTIVHGTRDEVADLYAPDVVIEMPFAPAGVPQVSHGREELRARMKERAGLWSFTGVDGVRLHETGDPEVLVTEYQVHGTVTATGREFTFTYIMVVRVRDGLIASSRDYFNVLESAAALDAGPEMIAGLIRGGS
ncbi:nuclear transport factor 2 family protein [Kitasatospora sp. NBC_01287]|uniref:nuclear transport factor 2 family protein n=1 Tax=Kitasatospora sp. NBC_01287 TaxID=2903573 RepID=UPI0022538CE6|nr:nuclear transport factor 2 family protein [Kitasatospora sp. NBC_01287]MCX4746325.1 nuclear transport factor 2 family protein [Kitasatospora sp. NBC_01287]